MVVEELYFVVDGQLKLPNVFLATPFNRAHKVRFILQLLLLAVKGQVALNFGHYLEVCLLGKVEHHVAVVVFALLLVNLDELLFD